jgi:hypothetical protein
MSILIFKKNKIIRGNANLVKVKQETFQRMVTMGLIIFKKNERDPQNYGKSIHYKYVTDNVYRTYLWKLSKTTPIKK